MAGERVSGTTFYVVDQQNWETGEGAGYFMWHGEGVQHSAEGPLGTSAIECHGAGFWDTDGSSADGICIIGAGDDVRTMRWTREKGEKVGRWEHLSGSGKFAGMTGGGTFQGQSLAGGRYVTQWDGEVTMAE